MRKPSTPTNEAARLEALHGLGIMYTAAEERYDRITRLASKLLDTPIALVTLVDERVQWFKSSQGLAISQTPREVSFCGHAILHDETFVVEDASRDERFADNPLVTGDPDIRFYAGHPLRTQDGLPVGTLCVIDQSPRQFGDAERAMLRDLALLVETELQREQLGVWQSKWLAERDALVAKASVDDLTRAWNRGAIMDLFRAEISRAQRGTPLAVAMIDIDWFKIVNDTYGHPTGDRVLIETTSRIRSAVRDFDLVGRYGGEEFLLVLGNCSEAESEAICRRVCAKVAETPMLALDGTELSVTVSIGVATYSPQCATTDALIAVADAALYRAKRGGRNRVESGPAAGA
jgi:diguanylate cyclase (GGDEF)-like protein